jgi:hypothetical protein
MCAPEEKAFTDGGDEDEGPGPDGLGGLTGVRPAASSAPLPAHHKQGSYIPDISDLLRTVRCSAAPAKSGCSVSEHAGGPSTLELKFYLGAQTPHVCTGLEKSQLATALSKHDCLIGLRQGDAPSLMSQR